MAAPNIVNVSTITGVTTFVSGISTLTPTIIISNAAASNSVLKLNTVMAANRTASTAIITLKIFDGAAGAGSSVSIGSSISVPSGSTLILIGKDSPIYIEENRSIGIIGITTSAFDVTASYEAIS
jgi:hypothetical protein